MTEHGLERLQHLFEAALTCLPEERVAFLDHACDGNSDLKAQVLRLLAVHEQESSFFDKPLGHLVPDVLADLVAGSEGRYVGAYHLKRRIGYGGMGAVYLAERADGQFEKQVAVKLIQTVRSEDLLRRFLSERQILASLEHPHIARLLDGGMTEEGQPYLVMEYVDGQPISAFCDAQQWGVPERLWLFLDVCEAVHYAHQNLIVHRDLKPSNILVTEDGTVKLLDFGIAKLLDPQGGVQAGLTQTTTRLMTPAYASPEQVRGEAITTASDVYQLGVLFYELLAGHNPHHTKRALLHEIEQAICELEPEKPSTAILHTAERGTAEGTVAAVTPESISRQRGETLQQLRRRLRGDLDTIALMALRKEPSRRYASTEQLAEDVRRYLEGRPVRAQGDALSYRAHKFVQRNKAAVFGAGLAVLAMILGMIGTTWQAAVAEQERARAEQRFEDVRELAGAFIFDVHDAIAPLAGSTRARQLVVEKALTYLDRLAQEEVDDPDLQRELANAYLKIGDIQGKPYTANLGDLTGAFESYEKARGILEALTTSEPSKMEAQHDLGRAYLSLGNVLHIRLGNMNEGGMYYLRALAVLDSLVAQDSTNLALWYDWTEANVKVGNYWEWNGGDQSKELAQYQKAERVLSRLLEKYPADEGLQESWALTHALQGWGMERAAHVFDAFFGDRERAAASYRIAREHFQRVLAVREPRLRADVANAEAQYAVAEVHGKIAEQAVHLGQVEEAFVHHFAPALTLLEQLWLSDPANAEAGILLSFTYLRIGNALMQQGRVSEARTQYRRALTTMEALQANGKMNDEARFDWAMTLEQMGEVLVMAREKDEAIEYYRQALELRKGLAQRNSSFAGYHKDVYYTMRRLVGLLVDNGQKSEATQLMSNHLTILKTRADSPTAQASEMELYALALLTCEPSHLRQPSMALAYLTRAVAHYEKKTPRFLGNLALAQYLNGDIIQARETMLQGLALLPPVDASGPANLDANFARLLRSLDTPMAR